MDAVGRMASDSTVVSNIVVDNKGALAVEGIMANTHDKCKKGAIIDIDLTACETTTSSDCTVTNDGTVSSNSAQKYP